MSRRNDVYLLAMQVLAALSNPNPTTPPAFGDPPAQQMPQPVRVGDEPEQVLEQIRRERRQVIETIEQGRWPSPHRRRPTVPPSGTLGADRAPGPQGVHQVRAPRRPRVTRGGGVRTRHRLGSADIRVLIFIVELTFVGTAYIAAQSPRERVELAAGFGVELGIEYLALRYFGAFAAAPLHGLFLAGDTPEEELREREFDAWVRREWPYHVHRIAEDMARDLAAYDRLLADTAATLSQVNSMTDPHYLTRRLTELSNAMLDVQDLMIGSFTQLSAEDLPAVRAKLVAMGVDHELVREMI